MKACYKYGQKEKRRKKGSGHNCLTRREIGELVVVVDNIAINMR
jgi:hypothetical protein